MARYGINEGQIKLVSGNVVDLPFEDDSFDFVCCDGVLPHLFDTAQVENAIAELGRVTRNHGHLFLNYLVGGGLIETKVHDAVRNFYKESPQFAAFVGNIKPKMLHGLVDVFLAIVKQHNNEEFDATIINSLLDEDLCISIQNVVPHLNCRQVA